MTKEHILVVDDEEDILELVQFNLLKDGYRVSGCLNGEDALAKVRQDRPALMILDLMLPGIDGLEVCKRLKADPNTRSISIIMLTARGDEADVVSGLELGADDFIIKPFSPRVLTARVKTVLRRGQAPILDQTALVTFEELSIDPARHEVRLAKQLIDLTATEFKILHLIVRQPGIVFTRSQIVDLVHGEDYPVTDRSIDVQFVGLRKKLGDYGKYIETVRGVGYRMRG